MKLTCQEFNELRVRLHADPADLSGCEQKAYAKHFIECKDEHRRSRENMIDDVRHAMTLSDEEFEATLD